MLNIVILMLLFIVIKFYIKVNNYLINLQILELKDNNN